jgi:hypothetical protein
MDESWKAESSRQITAIPKEDLTREMREILQRNVGDEIQARKELSALLTKYKRANHGRSEYDWFYGHTLARGRYQPKISFTFSRTC